MNPQEFESLVDRFSEGKTSKEEDLLLLKVLNASSEFLETFLKEIKIAQVKQDIISTVN